MDNLYRRSNRKVHIQIINIIFALVLMWPTPAGQIDYCTIFGKEWRAAEKYVSTQKEVWDVILSEFGIPTNIAIAVIFPELIRYSVLQDFIETVTVKAIYLQKGSKTADFSIGHFQMKPSFVEAVELEWMQIEYRHEYEIYFDLSNNVEARHARIHRLDDTHWQCIYLALFMKLLYYRFPQLIRETQEQQVRFCATAYNDSFYGNYETILNKSRKNFYHTDFIETNQTNYYAYADIAVYYYKKENNTITLIKNDYENTSQSFNFIRFLPILYHRITCTRSVLSRQRRSGIDLRR